MRLSSARRFGRRLTFAITQPRVAIGRVLGGRRAFTSVPWHEIDRCLDADAVIVEAGAADGSDTAVLAKRYPHAQVIACEPASRSFEMLASATRELSNVTCLRLALGDCTGTAPLYLARANRSGAADSSSLLRPTRHKEIYPHVSFMGTEVVQVTTLDALASARRVTPTFLWLDLQGAEILVLEASPAVRSLVRAVYMEVCRVSMYEGMPVYSEAVRQMSAWGFDIGVDQVGAEAGNILFVRR